DRRIARADALYAAVRQDLALRVAERYFGVLEAEDELGFAQATLEAFEQQLAQSRQRFEVGLIAITDVEEAKAGFDLSRAQLLAAQNALDIAREALREMTGAYQERLAPLRETHLVMPEPADIDQWTAIALEKNLRLLAARRDMETARQEIARIRAGHAPTLDAVGSFGLNDGDSGGALRETRRADVGLRLSFPLYSGGSILSRTRQSRHRYQRSLDLLERERRRVQRETRDAYLGVDSGISRVQALEQAVRSSQTAAEAIEAGFQVGTRTSVDVLNAQRDLFRARRDLSEARYRYVLDVLRLKRAAGTLSEDDLQLVSIWLG
ncbi:MAG: TolC family outer membrane protein, partial [Thiotrichales bacterium]|nr:TolC family outer membrane protein [Thiotrichales bacterium]